MLLLVRLSASLVKSSLLLLGTPARYSVFVCHGPGTSPLPHMLSVYLLLTPCLSSHAAERLPALALPGRQGLGSAFDDGC